MSSQPALLAAALIAAGPPAQPARLHAVRAALTANQRLSERALWLDRLPADAAASTRGPALAQLAAAARGRRRDGVRIRTLRIVSRVSDISVHGAAATALIRETERLQPCSLAGKPLGPPLTLTEQARVLLHRLRDGHYVVWQLESR